MQFRFPSFSYFLSGSYFPSGLISRLVRSPKAVPVHTGGAGAGNGRLEPVDSARAVVNGDGAILIDPYKG